MGGSTCASSSARLLAAAMFVLAAQSLAAADQSYPTRAIKIVVPVTAGGAPDVVTRIVAPKLSASWGQPVVVENRPGAGERIGAAAVAEAPPDGYTLLVTPPAPLITSHLLYANLAFDPSAFVPITILSKGHILLLARQNAPFADLAGLIAFARSHPGKLTLASPGAGTTPHLAGEYFNTVSGIRTVHVPYKGLAPALTDLLAGHVDIMFDNLGNSLRHIREGRVKALAIASAARAPELPDVPAISETYPEFLATSWFTAVAPPNTPAKLADKISAAIGATVRAPDVAQRLRDMSLTPVGSTPTEAAAFLALEQQRWRKIISAAGIRRE